MPAYQSITDGEKNGINEWAGGGKSRKFQLLFSAKRDGCTPQIFHQKCNNINPTITVVYGTTGYVFGGYANERWNAVQNTYVADPNAFLFRLRAPNDRRPCHMPSAKNGYSQIYNKASHGPMFHDGSAGGCFCLFTGSTKQGEQITLSGSNIGLEQMNQGFQNPNGLTSATFCGGNNPVYDIEVYTLIDLKLLPEDEPWRRIGRLDWTERTVEDLKNEIHSYSPAKEIGILQTKVLLVGQVGSGKSSFFNTINSVFRGYVTSQAMAGTVAHSLTTKYRQYEVLTRGAGGKLKLRLCDTMGLEEDGGLDATDIPYIMDGNIQDHFQFNPALRISPEHPDYKPGPKLKDKVHVVVFVVDSSKLDIMPQTILDKYTSVRAHVNQRGIGLVVLLTKVDKVCPETAKDVSKVFHSEAVRDAVDSAAQKIGVPRSQVVPVKNYESEIDLLEGVDILALLALRQMLRQADGFFDEQMAVAGYGD